MKYLILFLLLAISAPALTQDITSGSIIQDKAVELEKYEVESPSITEADQSMEDFMKEQYPIISQDAVDKIISSRYSMPKYVVNAAGDSSLTYNITYQVPANYTKDTVKLFWQLNIPEFQSKLFQLYKNDTIHIDTWNNVVGTAATKTYTGNFEAYRIRNWPSWKDPDKGKEHLAPTPPGPNNPLGLFVVHYDQNSLRYFHGTNKNKLVYAEMRNLSHGCVRNDNDNIAKMKEFIIKRVVKSKDLSGWLGSKKSLVYDFAPEDKFPVQIIYKTFDINKDAYGDYIIFFKDIYNYSNPKNIHTEKDDPSLITTTSVENIKKEFIAEINKGINEDQLNAIASYLISSSKPYQKYYFSELKEKFMIGQ